MPLYTYKRESTGEHRDVLQSMNDRHCYSGVNGDEQDWRRVFLSPNASIDTNIEMNYSVSTFLDIYLPIYLYTYILISI